MARKIQVKRGNLVNLPSLDIGEFGFAMDQDRTFIGGSAGNVELAKASELADKASRAEALTLLGGISDGTPLFAANTSGMTDTTRNYVNTTDGLLYTHNGTSWISTGVVYQATGINDGTVSLPKLSTRLNELIKQGKNLLDKADPDFKVNFSLLSGGGIFAATGTTTSAYIKVTPGQTISFSVNGSKRVPGRVVAYDVSKVGIGLVNSPDPYVVPENAAFIRVAATWLNENNSQIEVGTTHSSYEAYGYKINALKVTELYPESNPAQPSESTNLYRDGYVFDFDTLGHTPGGRADICFVNDELWVFHSSNDEHTDYKLVNRYTVDIANKTATLIGSFNHNWGHVNSIAYQPQIDALITGNGSGVYGTPGAIFIFENAENFKNSATVEFSTSTIQIDVTAEGWGDKINVVWGSEPNLGQHNICYVISNDGANVRKVLLGKGTNNLGKGTLLAGKTDTQFNGTFKVLEEWTQTSVDVVQGAHSEGGVLYMGMGHSHLWYDKHDLLKSGGTSTKSFEDKFYDPDGTLKSWVMQGITKKGDFIFLQCGYKIFIYKV